MTRRTALGAVIICVVFALIVFITYSTQRTPTADPSLTPATPTTATTAPSVDVPRVTPPSTPTTTPSNPETSQQQSPDAAEDETPDAIPVNPTPKWVPVMRDFAKNYGTLNSRTITQWRAALAPMSTPQVRKYLDTVKADQVLGETYQEYEAAPSDDPDQHAALVTFSKGTQKVIFMVPDGDTWKVDGIDDYDS